MGMGKRMDLNLGIQTVAFVKVRLLRSTDDLSHPGKASSTSARAAAKSEECTPCSSGTSNYGNIKSNFFTLVFATLASTLALIMLR